VLGTNHLKIIKKKLHHRSRHATQNVKWTFLFSLVVGDVVLCSLVVVVSKVAEAPDDVL
jgi:hypothetical protein